MKTNRTAITTALVLAFGLAPVGAQATMLNTGDVLTINAGTPVYDVNGYPVNVSSGSWFGMDTNGGWERQKRQEHFGALHADLRERMPISESQVRHLYYQRYLPLLACHERGLLRELEELGRQGGLLLGMDGLMPEGGEGNYGWCGSCGRGGLFGVVG